MAARLAGKERVTGEMLAAFDTLQQECWSSSSKLEIR
jgi:hypothetical protein